MWMMVQKAKLFSDEVRRDAVFEIFLRHDTLGEIARSMLKATTPKEHKSLGRKVRNFDHKLWDENKSRIVEEGNWWKFTNSKEKAQLTEMLLATGDRELVEASPFDGIWGIGFGANAADANRSERGENLLGKAIMNVRKRLREQQSSSQL
ncbi:hypothetical protein GTA08_BOTSDO05746 [Botryosphaeria dothidea]|uniref:NADAR domain-containing protein n=1 Tax=Botryosphaeria dothidea TaxID=55169 RepID=A0A8H4IRZ9_9PEZI|nr:hypothetical protein GTA08_BOTSDO05746 [Botryosphaeria dothidea]